MAGTTTTTTKGTMAQAPDPVKAKIAPYTSRSSLILFGGVGLIVAELLFSPQGWSIVNAGTGRTSAAPTGSGGPISALDLILQVAGLFLLLLIASVSDEGGTFALLFLAAVWLGWLYSKRAFFANVSGWLTPSKSAKSASSGGGGAGGGF